MSCIIDPVKRDEVFELLNNAVENGYASFFDGMSGEEIATDLLDCDEVVNIDLSTLTSIVEQWQEKQSRKSKAA